MCDWANVEVGGDFFVGGWALGHLGGRFTYAPKRDLEFHGALDREVGLGLGAGGQDACPSYLDPQAACDLRPWHDRLAFGAYAGGGAGYHFSFFALFARGRVQATAADGLPGTVYGTLHGGVQFRIARRVDLHASGGFFGVNVGSKPQGLSPYWDLGLSVYFDVPRRPRAPNRTARVFR